MGLQLEFRISNRKPQKSKPHWMTAWPSEQKLFLLTYSFKLSPVNSLLSHDFLRNQEDKQTKSRQMFKWRLSTSRDIYLDLELLNDLNKHLTVWYIQVFMLPIRPQLSHSLFVFSSLFSRGHQSLIGNNGNARTWFLASTAAVMK